MAVLFTRLKSSFGGRVRLFTILPLLGLFLLIFPVLGPLHVAHSSTQGVAGCAVPGVPGDVVAAAGANQATIDWSAAADNGTTISSYVVRTVGGPDAGQSMRH